MILYRYEAGEYPCSVCEREAQWKQSYKGEMVLLCSDECLDILEDEGIGKKYYL